MQRKTIASCALLLAVIMAVPSIADAQRRGRGFGNALRNVTGTPQVTQETLLPSAVHSAYADLDEDNPLAAADVTYAVTGVAEYDTFFHGVAEVRGSVAMANHVLEQADSVLDGPIVSDVFTGTLFTDTIGTTVAVPPENRQAVFAGLMMGNFGLARQSGLDLTDSQMQSVRGELLTRHEPLVQLSGQLTAAQESLASLPAAVTQLSTEAPGLASNATSAFSGPNAINAPRVLENVGIAVGQLESLPGDIANTGRALAAFTSRTN